MYFNLIQMTQFCSIFSIAAGCSCLY